MMSVADLHCFASSALKYINFCILLQFFCLLLSLGAVSFDSNAEALTSMNPRAINVY
jgi:hypothetical protein